MAHSKVPPGGPASAAPQAQPVASGAATPAPAASKPANKVAQQWTRFHGVNDHVPVPQRGIGWDSGGGWDASGELSFVALGVNEPMAFTGLRGNHEYEVTIVRPDTAPGAVQVRLLKSRSDNQGRLVIAEDHLAIESRRVSVETLARFQPELASKLRQGGQSQFRVVVKDASGDARFALERPVQTA